MNIIFYIAIPFFVLTMAAELWYGRKKAKNTYALKDSAASLTMGIGNLVIGALVAAFKLGALTLAFEFAPFQLGTGWLGWALAIIGVDFCMYWGHRAGHRVRFFWASHVVHHSSEHYNLSTALRQTWTGNPIGIIWYMPLALFGIDPVLILASFSINLLYQYWVHTEHVDKMPAWFEFLFSTPSHHRVHHSSQAKYLDKNYGGILIIFDRMFGTFKAEEERPLYGLTESIDSYNPLYIAFHEWIAMGKNFIFFRGFKNKVAAVFGPPERIKEIEDAQAAELAPLAKTAAAITKLS